MRSSQKRLDREAAAALNLLRSQFNEAREDKVEPGYYSLRQWSEMWQLGTTQVREMMIQGLRIGAVVTKNFNRASLSGRRVHSIAFYKIVKK